jgi:acrylyl-CoA reductase (NADPH)
MDAKFNALLLRQEEGRTLAAVEPITAADLPEGEVLVDVAYSSLNYKDALAVIGKGKIVRRFPFVAGIDLAGTVVESASPNLRPGDSVLLTGWGVGEKYWGGYAQKARVRAEWLLPLPPGLTSLQAMTIGTAGLTSMFCLMALEEHGLTPRAAGEVLVTGATGGVGSVAVSLLAHLGYRVIAATGRPDRTPFLKKLGASDVVARTELPASNKPLQSERWAAAIDTAGGETLAGVLSSLAYGGSVAACGLAGGSDLATTVFPFILRGVNLLGIDSAYVPNEKRTRSWQRLADWIAARGADLPPLVIGLGEIPLYAEELLSSRLQGRIVVDVNAISTR